jgi:hypothetical protein
MATYLKHKDGQPAKKRESRQKTQPKTDLATDYRDAHCVAKAIDGFASIFSTWVSRELAGDNAQPLYSQSTGYPVKVTLSSLDGEDEAFHSVELELTGSVAHSIADSLKRIADSMTHNALPREQKKVAG